jgi:hypothetical protein
MYLEEIVLAKTSSNLTDDEVDGRSNELGVRLSPSVNDVNATAEESALSGAVTLQRLVKSN